MFEYIKWKDFASSYGGGSDLLLAEVGISEYGDNTNSELGDKYSIESDDYPQYRLFLSGKDVNEPLKYEYTDNVESDTLAQFVRKNGIYLALNGCLKDFDELVDKFMTNKDKANRGKIGNEGKKLLDNYSGKEDEEKSGKYYMKVMAKINKDGDEYVSVPVESDDENES